MIPPVSVEDIMDIVEVEFEHQVYVMTDRMDSEELVLCIIAAEVVPMHDGCMGPYGNGGEVQIVKIRVVDKRFPDLIVDESDLTSDEYDRIEDRAYELATMSRYDFGGYLH